MVDRIYIRDLVFEGRHGCMPEERVVPQQFRVHAELVLALAEAGQSDDLTKTVDWGPLRTHIQAIIEGESCNLVETLAERIAAMLLATSPRITAVTVQVEKFGWGAGYRGVSITRTRQ